MKQKNYKEYIANTLPCIGYSILTGIFTGIIIFFFKFLAGRVETLSRTLYSFAKESWLTVLLTFLVLAALAFLMSNLHKAVPECKGGGIPRSEGILRGILPFRSLKTLIFTFIGSMVSFFAGLPCGSEGPAVLMGTAIGRITGKHSKKRRGWNRHVMTSGAGAGSTAITLSSQKALALLNTALITSTASLSFSLLA